MSTVERSSTPGYWEIAADGTIFPFDNPFFGGAAFPWPDLMSPAVGMATDSATGGYWEVATDGEVAAFNVPSYGSMGGTKLSQPVVGIAATPTG